MREELHEPAHMAEEVRSPSIAIDSELRRSNELQQLLLKRVRALEKAAAAAAAPPPPPVLPPAPEPVVAVEEPAPQGPPPPPPPPPIDIALLPPKIAAVYNFSKFMPISPELQLVVDSFAKIWSEEGAIRTTHDPQWRNMLLNMFDDMLESAKKYFADNK